MPNTQVTRIQIDLNPEELRYLKSLLGFVGREDEDILPHVKFVWDLLAQIDSIVPGYTEEMPWRLGDYAVMGREVDWTAID